MPTTQPGAYYILAYGSSVPTAPESYSITAALVPFAVQAVAPGTVGTGSDTIEIDGSMFDNNTTFQLQGPDSTVVNDTTVYLQDSSTAFVTFNLTGMPTGTYTVQATAGNSTTAQLTSALTVVAGTTPNIDLYVSMPGAVLPNSQFDAEVTFSNRECGHNPPDHLPRQRRHSAARALREFSVIKRVRSARAIANRAR